MKLFAINAFESKLSKKYRNTAADLSKPILSLASGDAQIIFKGGNKLIIFLFNFTIDDFKEEVLRLRKSNREVRDMSGDSGSGSSINSSQSLVPMENNRVYIVLAVFAILFGILLGKFLL